MKVSIKRVFALMTVLAMLVGVLPNVGFVPQAAAANPGYPELFVPNGDFEGSDTSYWEISGLPSYPVERDTYDPVNNSYALSLWVSDSEAAEIHASHSFDLIPGTYLFQFQISGQAADSQLVWTIRAGDSVLAQADASIVTEGWGTWLDIQTETFTLTENTEVTFDLGGIAPVGYWGHLDNLRLFGDGDYDYSDMMDWIDIEDGDFETSTENWSFYGLNGELIENNSSSI